MRIPVVMLISLALAACSGDRAGTSPDAFGTKPPCPALPDRATFDFFGEACTAAPLPVFVTCHIDVTGDHGWCIGSGSGSAGVSRPIADDAEHCPLCPAGTERTPPMGVAYCDPG